MGGANKYAGDVELALTSYDVAGFAIDHAKFRVNDGVWEAATGVTLSPVQVSFVSDVIEPNPGTHPDPGTNPMPKPSTGSETDSTTSEPELEPDNDLLTIFKKGLIASEELLRLIQERLQSTADLKPDESFTDIENHWARQFIDLLVRLKVINGYSDGTFKPNNSITRAEFATMLARLIPFVPTDAQPLNFEDVQEGYWAQASIDLLTRHGIIKGYTDGTFKPNDTITREEMTVMLMRLLEGTALSQASNVNFEDSSMVAAYARDSIMMAAKAGIIQGNKNIINPKGNASRAEVATMLIRLLMLDPRLQEIMES